MVRRVEVAFVLVGKSISLLIAHFITSSRIEPPGNVFGGVTPRRPAANPFRVSSLAGTVPQPAASPSVQEWPLVKFIRLIHGTSECSFLDNRKQKYQHQRWLPQSKRVNLAAICALMSTRSRIALSNRLPIIVRHKDRSHHTRSSSHCVVSLAHRTAHSHRMILRQLILAVRSRIAPHDPEAVNPCRYRGPAAGRFAAVAHARLATRCHYATCGIGRHRILRLSP